MESSWDPMVDEDCIDINGALIDQVMDILQTGGTFTVNGVLHNVLMTPNDHDVYNCLKDLETQGIVELVGENPLRWQLFGGSSSSQDESTENYEQFNQPMDWDDPEERQGCGYNDYVESTEGACSRCDESLNAPKPLDNQLREPENPHQKGGHHTDVNATNKAKGCPPPPSAALFQSLMSQSKHPSKPVPVLGGTAGQRGRPLGRITVHRGGPSPSAPYSPDESTGNSPPFKHQSERISSPSLVSSKNDHTTKIPQQTTRGGFSSYSHGHSSNNISNNDRHGTNRSSQQQFPFNQGGFPRQMNRSDNHSSDNFSRDMSSSNQRFEPRFPHQTLTKSGKTDNFPSRQSNFPPSQTSFRSLQTGFQSGQTSSSSSPQFPQPPSAEFGKTDNFPSRQSNFPPSQTNFRSPQTGFQSGQTSSSFPQPPSAEMFKSLASKGPQKTQLNSRGSNPNNNSRRPNLTANQSKVLEFMKENGKPCNTLQLAHACELRTKKDINPSLYQMQSFGLIIKMHDNPPTWKLRADNRDLINSLTSDTNSSSTKFPSRQYENFPPRLPDNTPGIGARPLHPFGKRNLSVEENPVQKVPHFTSQSQFSKGFPQSQTAGFSQHNKGSESANQDNQTQALSRIVHSSINQNPVSALNEYAQKNRLELTYETLNERRGFAVSVVLGGKAFPPGRASNSKDARREACDVALRSLLGQNQGQNSGLNIRQPSTESLRGARTHFDLIAALSQHTFVQIAASIEENIAGRKVVACFVMKRGPADTGQVVSLGTGNRCVIGERLSMEGKVVNDSHAEIVARRSLHRFLYAQIQNFYDGLDSIFEQGGKSSYLTLKKGVSFHLYISTAPCGDGALFTPRLDNELTQPQSEDGEHAPEFTSKVQGILRTKIEDGEGTIPIDPNDGPQTWDGLLRGQRLRTMSCSDKICRWNVVGLQGALLTHFIEPIYLGSLTLGYLYDHGHLSRAVCCRLQHKNDLGAELCSPFRLHHPLLGRVTAYEASRHTEKTNNMSVNWAHGDTHAEVIDGRTGACLSRTKNIPTPARICKASLYGLFRDLCLKTKRNELLSIETYREAKNAAKQFQEAKKMMFECFRKSKYGSWVSKPAEQEMF